MSTALTSFKSVKSAVWVQFLPAVFHTFISAAALVNAQPLGDFQISSNVSQCAPATVSWTGGTAPYILIALPSPVTSLDVVEVYGNLPGHSFDWVPDYQAGSTIVLGVHDSTGAGLYAWRTVHSGNDTSCLKRSSTGTTTSSTSEATSTAVVGDSAGSPSLNASRHGLSGGAIAGIVVSSLLAVILFALCAIWIQRRRLQALRKRSRATRSNWQVLGDMPYKGEYAFGGGNAQIKNDANVSAPPCLAAQRLDQK